MFYRIILFVNTPDPLTPTQVTKLTAWLKAHAFTVNPDQPDAEPSLATYHQCFHDEHPPQPCNLLKEFHT